MTSDKLWPHVVSAEDVGIKRPSLKSPALCLLRFFFICKDGINSWHNKCQLLTNTAVNLCHRVYRSVTFHDNWSGWGLHPHHPVQPLLQRPVQARGHPEEGPPHAEIGSRHRGHHHPGRSARVARKTGRRLGPSDPSHDDAGAARGSDPGPVHLRALHPAAVVHDGLPRNRPSFLDPHEQQGNKLNPTAGRGCGTMVSEASSNPLTKTHIVFIILP